MTTNAVNDKINKLTFVVDWTRKQLIDIEEKMWAQEKEDRDDEREYYLGVSLELMVEEKRRIQAEN